MSTTSLTAGEVMDWVAALMNDVAKSSYTYITMLPYLNMAIDELLEELERHNLCPTNETAAYITVNAGTLVISADDGVADGKLHYPTNLIEIRQLWERLAGSTDTFVPMRKQEFLNVRSLTTALVDWAWLDQEIRFIGANSNREVKIDYIQEAISAATSDTSVIGIIGVKSYLAYKAASLCAKYIAENPTRAQMLKEDAEGCLDNLLGIKIKGNQSTVVRRRPFRASFKSRGWN